VTAEVQPTKGRATLPPAFDAFVAGLVRDAQTIEGHLTPKEIRFLALLAACPTARGEILEIGSFKGKSTIVLSKAAALAGDPRVVAVDPMTAPSSTDPDLGGAASSLDAFWANARRHKVDAHIELHCALSSEVGATWSRPLRLLWIDGDHTYAGASQDFDLFGPHLADGAVIALHDVLHAFEGGLRVFMEDVVLSPHFAPVGCCGSIGWGQFHADPAVGHRHRARKLRLYRRLSGLVPHVALKGRLTDWEHRLFKLRRARIPHGEVDPAEWVREVSAEV
jgi:hypothetical protein